MSKDFMILKESMVDHSVAHWSFDQSEWIIQSDVLIEECAVLLDIEGQEKHTVWCTPSDVEALAVGHAFCEGWIRQMSDVITLAHTKDHVAMKLKTGGVKNRTKKRKTQNVMQLNPSQLLQATEDLFSHQTLFRKTGASHAVALYSAKGECLGRGEDVARHYAFDKAIGRWMMTRESIPVALVVLSGRINKEMMQKVAYLGSEIVLSVSAPTAAAIQIAAAHQITVCGFVRPTGFNVYTCRERII